MNIQKAALFLADAEEQAKWYLEKESQELANRYLDSLETTCQLLQRYPRLGPTVAFKDRRLKNWRYFPTLRPFQVHLIFYEINGDVLVLRRVVHGRRNLPRRLLGD